MRDFFRNELSGWKTWEVIYLAAACGSILILSLILREKPFDIICAVTGVATVVLTGKGKCSAYFFGIVNTLLYSLLAYRALYYGEAILNLFYYFPMQFYGFYVWRRHMNEETHEVEKRKMKRRTHLLLAVLIAAMTLVYGLVLTKLGGSLPFMDAFGTVTSLVVMVVSVRMYIEQWIIWTAENIVTVTMWVIAWRAGTASFATLLMWVVYLINALLMFFRWKNQMALEERLRAGRENAA